jgi:HAE1 family hydrophobic/amphiphilic exporter-1
MWSMALVPDQVNENAPAIPSLQDAVKEALSDRPEAKENTIAVDVNRLDARLSHEAAKPQVDAFATFSAAGLAGKPVVQAGGNPFTAAFGPLVNQINELSTQAGITPLPAISFGSAAIPPVLVGGYGQSLSALTSGQFTTAVVGVNVSLPIRNRTAAAAEQVQIAEGKRLQAQKQQVEMAIEQDVRNALQLMASANYRLESAVSARKYAEDQYNSEQRQFQAGTSTVFLVLQRQTDLIAARTREVRAEADRGQAQANLDRALARTLQVQNIVLN